MIIFFSFLIPAHAQNALFKPFTAFRVIKTEHFDIIFPKESESSARTLASYADRAYEYISSLLGIEVPGRIPVTFSPYTDMFNGYFSRNGNHIMLYDTPLDLEWTSFTNNLESLFIHELTHAVSLNSSTPAYRFWRGLFGNWVNLTNITAPLFMVEGVTLSFESLPDWSSNGQVNPGGNGRANDPRIKQYIRQAIHENKFLTPFQASGLYDKPIMPQSYYYEYGGLFSAWLQKTYGMEKYAELWQAMGANFRASFFVYRSDFYRIFKNVYNTDFLNAWQVFQNEMALKDLETNEDHLLPVPYRYLSEKEHFISGLKAKGDSLYYFDKSKRKISRYDTISGKIKSFNIGYLTYDFDVSDNGNTILVSGYNYFENRYMAVVSEHMAGSGKKTGKTIRGLYKARYFRDGVIGIRSELHNNSIVYEDFNGKREILFSGNENLMFSGPQALDNERIAFIAANRGIRELWIYNYATGELFKAENEEGKNDYWRYMRNLTVSEGKLFFSHNADDRMYKLGIIDLDAMQAVFSGRDFSGGVFNPVSVDGTIYYLGAFVSRNGLMRFPEKADAVSGEQSKLQLVRLDKQKDEAEAGTEDIAPVYSGPSKPYLGIAYMNPFKFWFPLPLVRAHPDDAKRPITFDGAGIFSIITDPTDRNMITVIAYADIPYRMANVEQFTWLNTSFGIPLTLEFTDAVIEREKNMYRSTNVSLYGTVNWGIRQWDSSFLLGGGYVRQAREEDKYSAYYWKESGSGFYAQSGYAFSYRRANFQANIASLTDKFSPRINALFQANADTRFPLYLNLFGVYDENGMDLQGVSNTFGTTFITDYTLNEYTHPKNLQLNWITGGEGAIGLFSINIQKHISHLYFNNLSMAFLLRNQIYDSKGHPDAEGTQLNDNLRLIQSLGFKLALKTSFFPFVKTPVYVEPFMRFTWNYSNTVTGKGNPWAIYFDLNTSF
jgi:hypothetical protein